MGPDGNPYVVTTTGPSGTPGTTSSSGYMAIGSNSTGSSRPGRDTSSIVQEYNPVDAQSYTPGQLVTYNGQLYQVMNTPATGTPRKFAKL
jgi:hypothetical protein